MLTGKQLNMGIRQVGFVILLVALSYVIIDQLQYFLSSILGSFTLYMLLRRPHRKLVQKGLSKGVATTIILIATVIVVFVLGGAMAGAVLSKFKAFEPAAIIANVNQVHDFLLDKTGYNIFSKDVMDKAVSSISGILPNIVSATGGVLVNGFMMIFLLFFMLQGGREVEAAIEEKLPVSPDSISLIKKEVHDMVVSNAVGIPIVMAAQGITAGVVYWALGAGDPLIWGILTGIFGLVPVVGTAVIWVPLAVGLFVEGNVWQSIALIAYGAIVVSNVDNLFRMILMKKQANVHPLITIFGIILGMNIFGFWGIVFGPLMLSGFLLLLKIYRNEFLTDVA